MPFTSCVAATYALIIPARECIMSLLTRHLAMTTSIKTSCELVNDKQYLTQHTVEDVFQSFAGLRYRVYFILSRDIL